VAFAVTAWVRLRALDASNDGVVRTASAAASKTSMEDGTTPSTGSEQYTLEPFDTTSPSAQRETTAQRSAREQRYEELLRAAPPASAKPTEQKPEPSFIDRVVAPIANALGMNRGKPQPTAPAPPMASQRQPANNGRSAGESPRTSTSEEPTKPREDDDPETDLIPPQLLTADFSPSQIQDGDETTFAVMVNDNLSGVRSVSGVISSPSNSLQGFSCTRDGESNRYVAKIIVPKDAPSGTWVVKYLTLSDNASNSVNLNKTQGSLPPTAEFKVSSSAPDSTGPTLKQVYLEKQAMRAGDRNTVFVQAEDDKAGVTLVSGVFVSPAKYARIGFGCRAGSNGIWECPLSPPSCLDCGIWTLEQIQLKDKADNLSTFRGDNPIVRAVALDIAGNQCDATPPQVTQLTLNPTSVSNTQSSIITVTATVVDEGCGASSLSAQAIPPGGIGGQRRPVTFVPSNDGLTFTGRLEVPQFAAKGVWTISWIQALDKGLNLKAYGASDPVAASATFRVE
jgi:hypothetical protein